MKTLIMLNTPSDFRATLHVMGGNRDFTFVQLKGREEPIVRRLLDQIFGDIQYVGGDEDLIPSYLEGIEEPLGELHSLGLGLMAVVRPEIWRSQSSDNSFTGDACTYGLFPLRGFFADGPPGSGTFHRLARPCDHAAAILKSVMTTGKPEELPVARCAMEVRRRSDGEIKWCAACAADQTAANMDELPTSPFDAFITAAGLTRFDDMLCDHELLRTIADSIRKLLENSGWTPEVAAPLRATTGRDRLATGLGTLRFALCAAVERAELTHAERLQALALLVLLSNQSLWSGDAEKPVIARIGSDGQVVHVPAKDYVDRMIADGRADSAGDRRIVASEEERKAVLSLADGSCHPVLDAKAFEGLVERLLREDGGKLQELDRKFREAVFILEQARDQRKGLPTVSDLAKRVGVPRGWFYGESEKGRRFQDLLERMKGTQELGKGPARGVKNARSLGIDPVDEEYPNVESEKGEE